jgi:hypothetical protein
MTLVTAVNNAQFDKMENPNFFVGQWCWCHWHACLSWTTALFGFRKKSDAG